MPHRHEQSLRVLGLEPGASEQAIKDAHRDLVKVWHPDRFGSDAPLREKAQEKLKEVNAAFADLRGYRGSRVKGSNDTARPGDGRADFTASRNVAPPLERSPFTRTTSVLIALLVAALTGTVGTGLYMSRNGELRTFAPADDSVGTSPPAVPVRAPSRQPVRGAEPVRPPSKSDAHEATNPAMAGSLSVASRPAGARVSFDGRFLGETPILVTDLAPGEHHVELTLDGKTYERWSGLVVVTAGRDEKLLAVMTPTARER